MHRNRPRNLHLNISPACTSNPLGRPWPSEGPDTKQKEWPFPGAIPRPTAPGVTTTAVIDETITAVIDEITCTCIYNYTSDPVKFKRYRALSRHHGGQEVESTRLWLVSPARLSLRCRGWHGPRIQIHRTHQHPAQRFRRKSGYRSSARRAQIPQGIEQKAVYSKAVGPAGPHAQSYPLTLFP